MIGDDISGGGLRIKGSEKGSAVGSWIGFLIFGGIFGWFFYKSGMPFLTPSGYPNPVMCFFGVAALLPLVLAVRHTIRLQMFGDPALELDRPYAELGGTLSGRIELGSRMTRASDFAVRLACYHSLQQAGEKNPRITKLWSGDAKATMMPGGVLPISIAVPEDQPATDESDPLDRIYWELMVKASFFPVSFAEKYRVLVRGSAHARAASTQIGTTQRSNRIVPLLFFIPAFIGGMALFYYGCCEIAAAITAQNWPTTQATVVSSQVYYRMRHDSNNTHPEINYTYTVNGIPYTGSNVYPHWFWSQSESKNVVAQFRRQSTAEIHYELDHPENAFLLAGLRPGVFQGLICAGLALSLAQILGVAVFARARDVIETRNSIMYKAGTVESKISGFAFLQLIVFGLLLYDKSPSS